MSSDRKWLPTFSDLVDRMSIHQLKEVLVPEHKDEYAADMCDLEHDIDMLIEEKDIKLTGRMVRAIIVLSQMNCHIWHNEADARKGKDQDLSCLRLSHGLNGIRNRTMNLIKHETGDVAKLDWKTDCLAASFKDWEVSLLDDKEGDE